MKKLLPAILLICLLMAGCKTSRQPATATFDWQRAEIPFKLNVPLAVKPSGKAWMVRDSSIYLSVRVFGMEMMSFYANNDSAFLYDKTKNTLVCGPLGKHPVTGDRLNAGTLQNLMLGIDLNTPRIDLKVHSFDFVITPLAYSKVANDQLVETWQIRMIELTRQLATEASLTWNYSQVNWQPDHVQQWKRPSKPKQTLGIDDLYNVLAQQF